METNTNEAQGGITWLLCAGAAALALSTFLFWADNSVMGGAQAAKVLVQIEVASSH